MMLSYVWNPHISNLSKESKWMSCNIHLLMLRDTQHCAAETQKRRKPPSPSLHTYVWSCYFTFYFMLFYCSSIQHSCRNTKSTVTVGPISQLLLDRTSRPRPTPFRHCALRDAPMTSRSRKLTFNITIIKLHSSHSVRCVNSAGGSSGASAGGSVLLHHHSLGFQKLYCIMLLCCIQSTVLWFKNK